MGVVLFNLLAAKKVKAVWYKLMDDPFWCGWKEFDFKLD